MSESEKVLAFRDLVLAQGNGYRAQEVLLGDKWFVEVACRLGDKAALKRIPVAEIERGEWDLEGLETLAKAVTAEVWSLLSSDEEGEQA